MKLYIKSKKGVQRVHAGTVVGYHVRKRGGMDVHLLRPSGTSVHARVRREDTEELMGKMNPGSALLYAYDGNAYVVGVLYSVETFG